MRKIYFEGYRAKFENGNFVKINNLKLSNDHFELSGKIFVPNIYILGGSLDAKNADIDASVLIRAVGSKIENLNAGKVALMNGSSITDSNVDYLWSSMGKNTINGTVWAKAVQINSTLTLAKNAVLKVSDKNTLEFSKLGGIGKVYDEKTQAYYDVDGNALNNAGSLATANIQTHNFALAKAIENKKAQIDVYLDGHEHEKHDVELLNTQTQNNDALL